MTDDEIKAWETWEGGPDDLAGHFEAFLGVIADEATRLFSLMFNTEIEKTSAIDSLFAYSIQAAEIRICERLGKMIGRDWGAVMGALEEIPEDCTLDDFVKECARQDGDEEET